METNFFNTGLTVNPIIPIPVMAVVCLVLIVLKRKGIAPFIRQIVMVLLLFLANLRIMVPNDEVKVNVHTVEANVLFVIDDTLSILARDYDGDKMRLEGVKADCSYIIDRMTGSRFSVISFHNNSQILCPYSKETEFVKSSINALYPLDRYSAKGSDLRISLDNLLNMLRQGEKMNNGYNIVFFISDGEDNINNKVGSFADAAEYIDGGAVLGYGSEKGGEMYVRTYGSDEETLLQYYDKDNNYELTTAISKIDEKNLKSIASDMGVEYIHMTDKDKLDRVIDQALRDVDSTTKEEFVQGYDETYFYFVIALFVMLIVEYFLLHKKIKENRV